MVHVHRRKPVFIILSDVAEVLRLDLCTRTSRSLLCFDHLQLDFFAEMPFCSVRGDHALLHDRFNVRLFQISTGSLRSIRVCPPCKRSLVHSEHPE